ncbi:11-beta-hydroxysteroid dehydrogenase B isoform X1 [Malania oleifera]|uniref:11-beta-hydroxysteroid dehydrogenase B isoform X1 n=1 Tax=Malania oleifera TaxID=397392 RepID=UPI0025AE9041|nr:11-beta-hydroxysteroid dehydrogenase B isoform X1 [Malania oleifera]
MDLLNSFLDLVVPPAYLVMLALAWPAMTFINACEKLIYSSSRICENMEDKVVVVTGASSAIGEQITYEYAKMGANLVLIARREYRLRVISENARLMGAKHVMFIAADVIKEEDCRRFIREAINFHGHVDHLVNTTSLGHAFYFEEVTDTSMFPHLMDINFWGNVYPTYVALPYLRQSNGRIIVNASVESWLPLPRISLYAAAKAALVNFYETLRFELKDEVGITIATHGWIGSEMMKGKFMVEEGAEMHQREESEVHVTNGAVADFARLTVSRACKGDAYVKYPSWYGIFLLYKVFAPNVLHWTFRLLETHRTRKFSLLDTSKNVQDISTSSRKLLAGPIPFSLESQQQQLPKIK